MFLISLCLYVHEWLIRMDDHLSVVVHANYAYQKKIRVFKYLVDGLCLQHAPD